MFIVVIECRTQSSSSVSGCNDYLDRPPAPPHVLVDLKPSQENAVSLRYDGQSKEEVLQPVGGSHNPPATSDYGLNLVPPAVQLETQACYVSVLYYSLLSDWLECSSELLMLHLRHRSSLLIFYLGGKLSGSINVFYSDYDSTKRNSSGLHCCCISITTTDISLPPPSISYELHTVQSLLFTAVYATPARAPAAEPQRLPSSAFSRQHLHATNFCCSGR